MKSGIAHSVPTVPVLLSQFVSEELHDLVHGTSFPASPVERQLFYRDDLHTLYIYNGTAWLDAGGASTASLDNLGDVNVPTPSDHDIIDWDAATSKWGKRALGDMGAHHARHEYLGADEIQNVCRHLARHKHVDCFWESMDKWTLSSTGTGSTASVLMQVNLFTGATQNSKAYLYSGIVFPSRGFWSTIISIRTVVTDWETRLWMSHGDGITPVDTEEHVGFTIIDGDVFASCADGAAETRVDTGVNIARLDTRNLTIIGNATGTEFKFYVDHVLKATITTNTPTVWTHRWMLNTINDGVAADRGLWVFGFTYEDFL